MTTLPTTTRKEIQTKRILVVEDEETIALGVKDMLEHAGYQVGLASEGKSGLAAIRWCAPSIPKWAGAIWLSEVSPFVCFQAIMRPFSRSRTSETLGAS